ncbi:zinc-binding metallopeptidase family protein [Algoriphagus machipongonensis]|uniref:Aminopeptidase, M42 family n=1 Tax=Algoriphagus machipongonensis TaxID=388413 RepID=A3I295_9BACT|nr:aminopeptidase [Algoriphagus machipongonensis]EAZ79499.1 aminopeptidase, M42 family [Algoriphagus machipongonensis]
MKILNDLLALTGVSGDEANTAKFINDYVEKRKNSWKVLPKIYSGEKFHDCILLKFGNPDIAVFAHIDTIGFMSRYYNQLIPVGGPEVIPGTKIIGEDSLGEIRCQVQGDEEGIYHDFPRGVDTGTYFSFEQNVRIDEDFIQAAYLDNRIGVYNALKQCETIENGWIVFSTYEEHGGGSMPFLLRFIQETAPITKALVSDITWITDGVKHHEGVVISIRDRLIPRRSFLNRVLDLAKESEIPFQLEVEESGGSDGREIQFSPYAIDWCFIGAAEGNVHSPDEKVSLSDIDSMISLYNYLLANL